MTGLATPSSSWPHPGDEAHALFQNKSYGAETIYLQEDKSNAPVSERTMSLSDRLAFREAKQKELESFFRMTSGSLMMSPTHPKIEFFGPSSS